MGYPLTGETKDINFGWTAGISAGLGINLDWDGWDLQANYQHLTQSKSREVSPSGCGNATVMPLNSALCSYNDGVWISTGAKSSYDFDFNTVDLQLGRNYFLSHYMSARTFFGVKAAFIDLDQHSEFCGGDGNFTFCNQRFDFLGGNALKVRDSNKFSGAGPEMGFQTQWFLAKGFSFFADGVASLMYGYFDVDHTENVSAEDHRIDLTGNTHRMVPMAGIVGGMAYDIFFDDDKQHIGFRFGYDTQYYWRVNQMLHMESAGPSRYDRYSEDVALRGIVFEGRWDF